MPRVRFQARLNSRDDPEDYKFLMRLRDQGFTDRDILKMSLKAIEGWSPEEIATVSSPIGTLKRVISQVLEDLGFPTTEKIEKAVGRAVEGIAIAAPGGKSSRKRRPAKGLTNELQDMLDAISPADDDDWPEDDED